MDANVCDMNHLDRDVLLPPRKRLLAGLKKQNLDSQSNHVSPPSTPTELDLHLNNKLNHHLNSSTLSREELAESSRSAAIAAMKVAKAARAAAEEKAAIAVKAVAAAKSALELSASVSEETASTETKEQNSNMNKLKKHIPVQHLYKNHRPRGSIKTDEELARKLHQDMNNSLRISKNSSSSNLKNHKHKKLRLLPSFERARNVNGRMSFEGNSNSKGNTNAEQGEVNSVSCSRDIYTVNVNGKTSQFCKDNLLEMGDRDAGPSHSMEKILDTVDDTSPCGRKRGRVKLKKLSLSICAIRDQDSPKKVNKSSTVTEEEDAGKSTAGSMSLLPMDLSTDKGICRGFINMDMPGLQGTSMPPTK